MVRYISVFFIALALACSCQHDLSDEAYFNVTLSSENTYVAGEPVTFNFTGDIDNILFYSGELGSEYRFKDRYTVPVEDVKGAMLDLEYQALYGTAGAMEVWISNKFTGLNGNDGDADRQTLKTMYPDMQGWTRLDYAEGKSATWTEQMYSLTDSLDSKQNFSLAFHWKQKAFREPDGEKKYLTQRTYWVNGKITLDIDNVKPMPIDLSELTFNTVMMNEEADPYMKNNGNGSIVLNSSSADIIFQGVGQKDSLDYAIDAWAISAPIDLNSVANDQGLVIKNQQNYLPSFSYTWKEPGTYSVAFVGTNSNYSDSSMILREMSVTILPSL